ncbi:sigma-70 family RNA polymerase sigma factor [Vibrio sp. S11_S32]|uniref:sigma-70 family RNA polymerase sigma factor n=1 Tax=Vibrio sp. S11_S32 TaxID=2720225 RepID=UPI001EEF5116|nr:sigma-70 family RNA polymerase sigma factor [Vibrio sp. S11_S32]
MQQIVYRLSDKEIIIAAQPLLPTDLTPYLILVAKHQDKHAFNVLFTFFAPKIKRFGISKLNSEALAKELIQETMTKVWRKAHLYHPDKSAATTWIYTIMRNTAFDMLRQIQSRSEESLSDDIWPLDSIIDSAHNTEQTHQFEDHLLSKHLLLHLDRLPEAQQQVIRGLYYQDLSQEQLAQHLDIPIGTIKSRLRLALEKLKQYMGEKEHD